MTTTQPSPAAGETGERRCEVCRELRRVIVRVGPLPIKEPCPHKCAAGYVKHAKDKQ